MAFRNYEHGNMDLFCDRLWSLMETKNIDTPEKLAAQLFDNRLVTWNGKEKDLIEYDYDGKIRKNAIESIKKKIERHLNSIGTEKLQGEYVNAYCKFFGCSADFLFGYIPQSTHEVTDISEYTGLSEISISVLHSLNATNRLRGNIDTLSLLIEDSDFEYFLSLLRGYVEVNDNRDLPIPFIGISISVKEVDMIKSIIQNKTLEIADRIRGTFLSRYPSALDRSIDDLKQAMLNKVKEKLSQGKISKREYKKCCEEIRKGNFDYEIQEN